jgi:4-hydroxy-tetrahydrodipicolinate reductase
VIRVGMHGATGRMGRLVVAEIEKHADLDLAWACGRELPASLDADVIIDFSAPEALRRLMDRAACPVVSGTTGEISPQRWPGKALLHAANFSVGVAVLAKLVREARAALPSFDVEVVEIHHRGKRDAPSGTALRLAGDLGPPRHGRTAARATGEIGFHAVRGGDVVGEHRVFLLGDGERIELAHVATSRELFAAGAVRCARWMVGRPAGLYTIEDAIGSP